MDIWTDRQTDRQTDGLTDSLYHFLYSLNPLRWSGEQCDINYVSYMIISVSRMFSPVLKYNKPFWPTVKCYQGIEFVFATFNILNLLHKYVVYIEKSPISGIDLFQHIHVK